MKFNYEIESKCLNDFLARTTIEYMYDSTDWNRHRSFEMSVENEILDSNYFRGLTWFLLLINCTINPIPNLAELVAEAEDRMFDILGHICEGKSIDVGYDLCTYLYTNDKSDRLYGNRIEIKDCDIDSLSSNAPILGFNKEESILLSHLVFGITENADSFTLSRFQPHRNFLIKIEDLVIVNTYINELYIEVHKTTLGIVVKHVNIENSSGIIILNSVARAGVIVKSSWTLDHSQIDLVDLNGSSSLTAYRYLLSTIPTVPILCKTRSYYQEPNTAFHIKRCLEGLLIS